MVERIVTSYKEPDLDGISSMYAYVEYLNKIGISSDYYIKGNPKKEVGIVCELFNIKLKGCKKILKKQDVVLLDTNNLEETPFLDSEQIIEIIDHHSKNKSSEKCVNAKIQIERLGAVATLIAEKYKNNNIPISREAAILLYYGIISNSINLKSSITSQKDIDIVNWLQMQCKDITKDKIIEIFTLKSKIEEKDLRKEMEVEVAFDYEDKKITVAQLEIANVEEFLRKREMKIIEVLRQVKQENGIDYIFINCVDILNGFNIILTIDDVTKQFLKEKLGYQFNGYKCKLNKVVQRKEITKAIRNTINDNTKTEKHYAYMVRCRDNTIYSGYAVNPYKREEVHNSGKGAKYTRARLPVKLVYFEEFNDKKEALRREYEFKKYTHEQKENMIKKFRINR